MVWKKLGLIFCPNNIHPWMQTHAANPVAEHLREDVFRIYFSARNVENVSSIGFVDIDLNNPTHILNLSETPVLTSGERGTFDNDGVSIACIIKDAEKRYLYYLGWSLCKTVPFHNTIGLAISPSPDAPFRRYSLAPIVGRDDIDPFSISYPWVMKDEGKWKMWYGSHLKWGKPDGREAFFHTLKYAESEDGIRWKKHNTPILPLKEDEGEYAIARPCVLKTKSGYQMWYAYRGDAYRIGYAESQDGVKWVRKDSEVGIDVSKTGWDSKTIEYPFVFSHKGQKFMLYTGNDYGKTGFGLALWKSEVEYD